ncbi:patatin-like phospholipase family protein [Maribacter halichondriae]|uniref:patatin-like phospholipase family protein n=1 Tax=Maribacter halichondriae TaxID=2980554 RepID=UPI003076595C
MNLKSESVGLVLSGGGVRGMAHIGVIRALEEHAVSAKIVSGSSVGALVGALYANGTSVADMLSFFKETPLFKYNFFTIMKPGLVDTERYFEVFQRYFPEYFEELKRELYVVATNMQKGEEEFFSSGELVRPLLASAALPPVFSPLEINNCFYADGGIMNNFPLEPLKNKVDYIIGSNVSVIKQVEKKTLIRRYSSQIERLH